MRVISLERLPLWLDHISRSYLVMAPWSAAKGEAVQLAPHAPGRGVWALANEGVGLTFDYVNFLQPPLDSGGIQELFRWQRREGAVQAFPARLEEHGGPVVYFGVRPCDVAAMTRQDAFYLTEFEEPLYAERKTKRLVVALNCGRAGEFCFCASTGNGPHVPDEQPGADIVATLDGQEMLLEPKTARGRELVDLAGELAVVADKEDWEARKKRLLQTARSSFIRAPELEGIGKALAANYGHPLWEEQAGQCISCTGCTALCPTCTCFQVLERKDGPDAGVRIRLKDSCQTDGFTRNAGHHNPRDLATRFRYRIFDKLSHVERRFGFSACVGCGRCILTCPSGLDITDIADRVQDEWARAGKPEPLGLAPSRYEKRQIPADGLLYTPRRAVITDIADETRNIKRYTMRYADQAADEIIDLEGQFYMVTVYGVGEIAVSIPFGDAPGTQIEFCIKEVGKVTGALARMRPGDEVGLRGPYGKPFPYESLKGKDVLIVGSGVGLAPVRTIIVRMLAEREQFGKIAIIASATTYSGLVYADDLKEWAKVPGVDILYALAKPTDAVAAHVGLINDLLPGLPFDWAGARAILCASPRRIKFVSADLLKLGANPDHIFTSLETHMRCGVGKCGHCKVGSHYMCVDGPVFSYREMMELPPEF